MSARGRLQPMEGARTGVSTYAWFCGVFLLLQGASTLAARLLPEVDRAFPMLLRATRMVPAHSVLHIATALLAFAVVALGARATWWFAALFGSFYAGLGILGLSGWRDGPSALCGLETKLGLQPFDHPFHILLGLLGVVAAWRTTRSTVPASAPPASVPPPSTGEKS